jgi:hypothetical protein
MAHNVKNFRVMLAVLLTAAVTLLWQNCSEVAFNTEPFGLNDKAGDDLVVLPPGGELPGDDDPPGPAPSPTPTPGPSPEPGPSPSPSPEPSPSPSPSPEPGPSPSPSPQPSPSPEDPQSPGDSASACSFEVDDIIINLDYIHVQGDGGGKLPLQSASGSLSLKDMVSQGLEVTSLGSGSAGTVSLVLKEEGNFILDTEGEQHSLSTVGSHHKPGIKIRLSGRVSLEEDGSYVLKLDEMPVPKKYKRDECRLENNLPGSLVEQ